MINYNSDDKDNLSLPRQYMQKSDGGICDERSCEEVRSGG